MFKTTATFISTLMLLAGIALVGFFVFGMSGLTSSIGATNDSEPAGFNVPEVFSRDPGENGLGLSAMHQRARMHGGSLDIWSQEGIGASITFEIPQGGEARH